MSRVGKKPIALADNIKVKIHEGVVSITGPKGTLSHRVNEGIEVKQENKNLHVIRKNDETKMKALHGLNRALIVNMIRGVTTGYRKELVINGVGFKAEKKGDALFVTVGFSNPVDMPIPKGIEVKTEDKNTRIILEGIDRQTLGQFASDIRSIRPPEPYKGKGIQYANERIRRKVGKAGAK